MRLLAHATPKDTNQKNATVFFFEYLNIIRLFMSATPRITPNYNSIQYNNIEQFQYNSHFIELVASTRFQTIFTIVIKILCMDSRVYLC